MQIWAQTLLPEPMLMYDLQVAPSHFAETILSPPAVVHMLMDEHNTKIDIDVGSQQTYRSEPENYSLGKTSSTFAVRYDHCMCAKKAYEPQLLMWDATKFWPKLVVSNMLLQADET